MTATIATAVIEAECATCGFTGDVEFWEDGLLQAWGFECPNCGDLHENTVEPDLDDDMEWD